jgi:nickel-dependent lactate racemase
MLDYGDEKMPIKTPDDSFVMTPEDLSHDPPSVDPVKATEDALQNPLGMLPLSSNVKHGDKVIILCPDKVKGGNQTFSHRKTSIPIIVKELLKAGVECKDIQIIIANGLHRKNTLFEMRYYLGNFIVNSFWPDRLICHDAEDTDNLTAFSGNSSGNIVEFNSRIMKADLVISIGHVLGNPYGGFSGGYKMVSTGITTWRSISSHHCPTVMNRTDMLSGNTQSDMRKRMNSIGQSMEKAMGKKFFFVDAVLGTDNQILGVFSGDGTIVQEQSWQLAKKRTEITLDLDDKFDILVFGLPRTFHYGPGHGTNPILMLQAIGAQLIRDFGVLKDNSVIICVSKCDGWFNDRWFPSYRTLFNKLEYLSDFADAVEFEEALSNNPRFIRKYRFEHGYGAFHAFSMVYCGNIALRNTNSVIIVGARNPGYARLMGCRAVKTFDQALNEAKKYVGKNPRILVLPECMNKPGFHLFEK